MNLEALKWAQEGVEAQERGELQVALNCYQKAVEFDAAIPGLISNLGVVLTDLGEFRKAEGVFEEAIRLEKENPLVWNNRGNLWKKQKAWDRAIADYSHAIELMGDYVNALYNRGTVYFAADRLEEAEQDLRKALELNPSFSKGWVNLGELAWELNRSDEALDCFDKAIRCDEENAEAHWNRALWRLWKGDYARGWEDYEWRWALPGVLEFYPEIPVWRGQREAHLLVYAEQGFGDTIQFSRFLKDAQKRVNRLTVDVQDSILPWLQSFYPDISFVGSNKRPSTITHRIALQSLPLVLGVGKPGETAAHRLALQRDQKIQRIGFCWTGSEVDLRRRCPLELWKGLFEIPNLEWVSFQTGRVTNELKAIYPSIPDWGSGFQNFKETAEALEKVDALVTIDTALAHLAGTMGKPVYLMLPHVADWRWGEKGEKSDWYESVRCFQQDKRGDWIGVMESVEKALKAKN